MSSVYEKYPEPYRTFFLKNNAEINKNVREVNDECKWYKVLPSQKIKCNNKLQSLYDSLDELKEITIRYNNEKQID